MTPKNKNECPLFTMAFPLFLALCPLAVTFASVIVLSSENNVAEGSPQDIKPTASQNNLGSDTRNSSSDNAVCNCVVFRMDDIQDYWLNTIQNAVMDLFLSKNQVLSLGLIMNSLGNDTKVVDKIKEGIDKRLFELDVHGWDHVAVIEMSQEQQKESLVKAKEKMIKIFNTTSSVFIPPLSVFNNRTLSTLNELDFSVISSDIPEETKFNQNKSIFIADKERRSGTTNTENMSRKIHELYHLPATVFFNDFEKGEWIKIPNEEMIRNVTRNIDKYGYAVIVLHPQDFALSAGANGTEEYTFISSLDQKEMKDLSTLLDTLVEGNTRIRGFTEIVRDYG